MATLAPKDSPWCDVHAHGRTLESDLPREREADHLRRRRMGDEPDTVNKLRIADSGRGALRGRMGDIEPGGLPADPLMFESYEELDYVRDKIAPKLEKKIEASGYRVLNWGDAGWVHFFSNKPVVKLDDLRRLKMFTWAGGNEELELWKANGFRPVPLAATDIQMALKTQLIDVSPPPLYMPSGTSASPWRSS